jgi:hypothetical protein
MERESSCGKSGGERVLERAVERESDKNRGRESDGE